MRLIEGSSSTVFLTWASWAERQKFFFKNTERLAETGRRKFQEQCFKISSMQTKKKASERSGSLKKQHFLNGKLQYLWFLFLCKPAWWLAGLGRKLFPASSRLFLLHTFWVFYTFLWSLYYWSLLEIIYLTRWGIAGLLFASFIFSHII